MRPTSCPPSLCCSLAVEGSQAQGATRQTPAGVWPQVFVSVIELLGFFLPHFCHKYFRAIGDSKIRSISGSYNIGGG